MITSKLKSLWFLLFFYEIISKKMDPHDKYINLIHQATNMKKFALLVTAFIFSISLLTAVEKKENEAVVLFTPPSGWFIGDQKALPASVKVMVVGKGQSAFPPSMNLSTQTYEGTLKQYLKIVKSINDSQGYEWKDLGTIKTEAGIASLSQVDTRNEWGVVRQMHVILLKNGNIYILTAAALKDEFPKFYKEFFDAFHTLRVNQSIFDMLSTPESKKKLQEGIDQVDSQWRLLITQKQQATPDSPVNEIKEQIFSSEEFQKKTWKPFKELIERDYKEMGQPWQTFVINKTEDDLFN